MKRDDSNIKRRRREPEEIRGPKMKRKVIYLIKIENFLFIIIILIIISNY